jgi:maltooligosyltrehalose trehalohydrolase
VTGEFGVWAPNPRTVELVVEDRTVPMRRDDASWWHATVESAGAGTRYGFRLDGGPVRPDPRSAWQPEGIDALSAVVDHGAFRWTDDRWRGLSLRGAVLYELHVGTFSAAGTFDGVIEHLPHLVELGVDAIELMPVAEFSGDHGWGYDGVDLFAPHHTYGGPDGLKRLIDACHSHGLGVVLDVVYNHLGPAGNYLSEFGPYFSTRHRTNWGDAVNFDGPGAPEVRRFVLDNAVMWLRDYHVDGLRLDAVHAIVDESAVSILEALAVEVDALATQLGRPLFLVAESDLNDPRFVRSRDAGGMGLDASWADEWHHALHAALTGERAGYYEDFGSLTLLAKALRQAWVYDGTWSPHRGRHHGRPPTGLAGHQFVVCIQNHDQAGNRACGDRIGALVDPRRLAVAAALLLTGPFTPLLFQGEEWGATAPFPYFSDHRDPELGRAVSEGRRREFARFGWRPEDIPDPQDPETFRSARLDWSERAHASHDALLAWYRALVGLRRAVSDLSDPRLDRTAVEVDEATATLTIVRGSMLVLVNLGESEHTFLRRNVRLLAASDEAVRVGPDGVAVPPDAVAIVAPAEVGP